MKKRQERHIVASVSTAIILVLVGLLLWYLRMTAVVPEQEQGIELEVVEAEEEEQVVTPKIGSEAYGQEEVKATPAQPASPANEIATNPTPSEPPMPMISEEEILALERARKEQEEREAAEKARKKKEADAIAKANQFGNLFGKTGTNDQGDGDSQGQGLKGNPVGHGTSNGNNWTLSGRGLKGSLPRPANTFKQEGKVVVQIRVNAAGVVTNATISGGDVSDKQTQQLALEAARKAKFTEGDHDQIGTITYIFKLN